MLELAIAEAYRPRPRHRPRAPNTAPSRPATCPTKPKATSPVSLFRSRTPSTLLRTTSVTSHSRSFVSFLSRSKRPDTAYSERTVQPYDTARTDSLFSQASVNRATQTAERSRKAHESECISQLPVLPPHFPLPPQEELLHFDDALEFAIEDLRSAPVPFLERDIATCALEHLAYISSQASCVATCWPEFWSMLVHAVRLVASVLLSADIGVKNVLVSSLANIAWRWNEKAGQSIVDIARIAGEAYEKFTKGRREIGEKLGQEFARWLCRHYKGVKGRGARKVRILTLGVSKAILAALKNALAKDADLEIHLSVLSSLDQTLPSPPSYPRLHVSIFNNSAIGTASQGVHVLILEPTCINPRGDVQCWDDALGTAICVRTLSSLAKVVVLTGANSIASPKTKGRPLTGDVRGTDGLPELVPANFVDVYITEAGVSKVNDLEFLAAKTEDLERHILGSGDGVLVWS